MWSYEIPRPEGEYYRPRDVARMLGVSIDDLYSWIAQGKVVSLKIFYRGKAYHWIPEEEVERLKKVKIPRDRMLTTREAAEILGVRQEVVSELVRQGKLKGVQVGHRYKIPESEVLKLKQRRSQQCLHT